MTTSSPPAPLPNINSILEQFFKILSDNSLRINPAKCVFAAGSVKFLGHTVGPDGVRPLGSHVEALAAFPQPMSVKELQRFLGIINFYRCFLPGIAGTLRPLTDALRTYGKIFQWSPLLLRPPRPPLPQQRCFPTPRLMPPSLSLVTPQTHI
jgi:hypothetical protein